MSDDSDKRGFKGVLEQPSDAATQTTAMLNAVQALNKINKTLSEVFPLSGATSATATAGAATLPANPVSFLSVTLPDGTAAKIPLYNP